MVRGMKRLRAKETGLGEVNRGVGSGLEMGQLALDNLVERTVLRAEAMDKRGTRFAKAAEA